MRATDIVMDRVWQLETDTFTGTPGFVFAPISRVVEPDEDPTAAAPRSAADGGRHSHRPRSLFAAGDQHA